MRSGIDGARTGWHAILIMLGGPLIVLDSLSRIFNGKTLADHTYFQFIDVFLINQLAQRAGYVLIGCIDLVLFALLVKFTWGEIAESSHEKR